MTFNIYIETTLKNIFSSLNLADLKLSCWKAVDSKHVLIIKESILH